MLPTSLKIPAFRRLIGAMTLSALGSMMTFIVLPLVAWHETGSASTFAFILAGGAAGMLVAMPFGGVITDRFDRRHVMLVGQVCQLLVITTMLVAVRAELWSVLPFVEMAQTFLGSLTISAGPAMRRDVLTDDVRTQGTALQSAAMSTVQLVAPLLGGALYALVGFTMVMLIDLACVALAFVLVLGLRVDRSITRPNGERSTGDDGTGAVQRTIADIRDGLRVARSDPFLTRYLIAAAIGGFGNGLVLVSIVPWLDVELGMPAEFWGVALAIMGGSGVAASLVVARIGERISAPRMLAVGSACFATGSLALAGEPSLLRLVFAFAVIGCTNATFGISCGTLVQRRVASTHQGRINSLWACSSQAAQLVATLLAGVLLGVLGAGVAMHVAIGAFCVAAAIYSASARAARATAPASFSEEELALSA